MNTQQFTAAAIEGSQNYFDYPKAAGRGREEIEVVRVETEDATYLLHLSKNSFSTDAVIIVIDGHDYSQAQIKVVEQDRDRRILYVRAAEDLPDPLIGKHAQDIQVVLTLSFSYNEYTTGIWVTANACGMSMPCRFRNLIG